MPLTVAAPTRAPPKVIGRRALAEIRTNEIVNLGVGLPEAVANAAAETGRISEFALTVEGTIHSRYRSLRCATAESPRLCSRSKVGAVLPTSVTIGNDH